MYPDILHTGKKVRLQIRIDHKMFDMFTSRNVKKIFKYPLSCPTTTSDQIVGLRECRLSNLSDILGGICPTWEYDHWYTCSVLYILSLDLLYLAITILVKKIHNTGTNFYTSDRQVQEIRMLLIFHKHKYIYLLHVIWARAVIFTFLAEQ